MSNYWDNTKYQHIISVKEQKEYLTIGFQNGDLIEIAKQSILPSTAKDIKWEAMTFSNFDITVPTSTDDIIIPWDRVRVITDAEFSKFLVQQSGDNLVKIGIKLRQLREKHNILSKDLATRTNLTPQTISRIEKGKQDLTFGTLRKILVAMGYTLKDLEQEKVIDEDIKSFNSLIKKLTKAGVDYKLLTTKIIPNKLQKEIEKYTEAPDILLNEAASYVSNVYGWSVHDIWFQRDLKMNNPANVVYYKKSVNANTNQITAYTHYANYLATIVAKSVVVKKKDYPGSLEEFKRDYINRYKKIDLDSLLRYVWGLGICVLPLSDSGIFHGASLNIEGRHVIILKQKNASHARWIFDLLHELYHVFAHLGEKNSSIIETEEINPISDNNSPEELEANSFANKFIFDNKADELAQKCIKTAQSKMENLKSAVKKVAEVEGYREDFIANYLAFRLDYQGQDWWAVASNLQIDNPIPKEITANYLKNKINIENLNPIDANLINSAISN